MVRGIFDNPWQLVIVLLLFVLLFGAKRLPDAARGVGRSLRIFKAEMKDMQEENRPPVVDPPPPGAPRVTGQTQENPDAPAPHDRSSGD